MLSINPSTLRATLNESATAPVNGSEPADSGRDAAGFASLLRQTRLAVSPNTSLAPTRTPEPAPGAASPTEPTQPHTPETASEAAHSAAKVPATPTGTAKSARPLPAAPTRHTPTGTVASTGPKPGASTRAADTARADATDRTQALLSAQSSVAEPVDDTPLVKPEGADTATAAASDVASDARKAELLAPTAPIDPSILHWMAGLQRMASAPAETQRPTSGARGIDNRSAASEAARDLVADGSSTSGTASTDPTVRADMDAKACDRKAVVEARPAASNFATGLTEQRAGVTASSTQGNSIPAASGSTDTAAATAAAMAAFAPAPTVATPAAVVAATLATPIAAPEFAQALGVQVSMLTRDGVQHAELQLTPSEMGPVSVQIVMDGTQAHVDFGADLASTRQAIEASLPELASALRDAGFTLAGGGVSQHSSRGRGGADDGDTQGGNHRVGSRPNRAEVVGRVAPAVRRFVSAGGVDLFA